MVHPLFFFLMIRRPPRSTLDRSSAASDVYKRQLLLLHGIQTEHHAEHFLVDLPDHLDEESEGLLLAVSYTHLRAHETVLDLVCRLLLEKKKTRHHNNSNQVDYHIVRITRTN